MLSEEIGPKLARGKPDQLSLRADSLTAIKRRSWAQTDNPNQSASISTIQNNNDFNRENNNNIWHYLVEEQKKGRTHISFADIIAKKRSNSTAATSATLSSGTKTSLINTNNKNNVKLYILL